MDRVDAFREPDQADGTDPSDQTVINGAPYAAHKANQGGAEEAAAHLERQERQAAEEIKRRQLALMARYVSAVRAR